MHGGEPSPATTDGRPADYSSIEAIKSTKENGARGGMGEDKKT